MRFLNIAVSILSALGTVAAFTNPIRRPGGSDPQVTYTGGYYYMISTSWTDLRLARATTIAGLKTAQSKVIYTDSNASRCCNMWAPELHYFGNRWYIYYTAGNANNLDGQRMHAIVGKFSPTPPSCKRF